jgi:hypothetical protein
MSFGPRLQVGLLSLTVIATVLMTAQWSHSEEEPSSSEALRLALVERFAALPLLNAEYIVAGKKGDDPEATRGYVALFKEGATISYSVRMGVSEARGVLSDRRFVHTRMGTSSWGLSLQRERTERLHRWLREHLNVDRSPFRSPRPYVALDLSFLEGSTFNVLVAAWLTTADPAPSWLAASLWSSSTVRLQPKQNKVTLTKSEVDGDWTYTIETVTGTLEAIVGTRRSSQSRASMSRSTQRPRTSVSRWHDLIRELDSMPINGPGREHARTQRAEDAAVHFLGLCQYAAVQSDIESADFDLAATGLVRAVFDDELLDADVAELVQDLGPGLERVISSGGSNPSHLAATAAIDGGQRLALESLRRIGTRAEQGWVESGRGDRLPDLHRECLRRLEDPLRSLLEARIFPILRRELTPR